MIPRKRTMVGVREDEEFDAEILMLGLHSTETAHVAPLMDRSELVALVGLDRPVSAERLQAWLVGGRTVSEMPEAMVIWVRATPDQAARTSAQLVAEQVAAIWGEVEVTELTPRLCRLARREVA